MRPDRLPRTYDECRARFRAAVADAGGDLDAHPIAARGPAGQELTIDVATIGETCPDRALLVLSGVHGVEGFVGSALQTDLVARTDADGLPDGAGIVLVHAVNPWGMAHDRRQNENNVDLNRNWRRSEREPAHNLAYDELHALACPDTPTLPPVDDLADVVAEVVAERGADWVRDGITRGQYRHADGLHFGGHETEESCAVLERELPELLAGSREVLTVDIHTGVGARGAVTLLSSRAAGSPQDRFLRSVFDDIDATVDNPTSASSVKSGPIAAGIADVVVGAAHFSVTAELGTAGDLEQLAATYQEQWVHRPRRPPEPGAPRRPLAVPVLLHPRRPRLGTARHGRRNPRPRRGRRRARPIVDVSARSTLPPGIAVPGEQCRSSSTALPCPTTSVPTDGAERPAR